MNLEVIENLVDLVARSRVEEVTVRSEEMRVTIRKFAAPPAQTHPEMRPPTRVARAASTSGSEPQDVQTLPRHWITSPMVGVFHPAEPAVSVGSTVESGRIVGAIESMKLMNNVRAERGGIVQEVAVEAGMAVEFGQPLFALLQE